MGGNNEFFANFERNKYLNKSCLRTIQLAYRGLLVTKPAYYNYSMTPKRSMCNFNSTAHTVSEMPCTQRCNQDS